MKKSSKIFRTLKDPPITKVISPLQDFIRQEAASSKILLVCIALGLLWANIPWGDTYNLVWNFELGFKVGTFEIYKPLLLWINDGLMAIFFFVIGLELKREFLIGGLSNFRESLISIVAATGGIIFPAIIFISINPPSFPGVNGWNIPIATDIAIALGILSLFSFNIPKKIKLLLASMAIFDDLVAIIIIAIFHSHSLNWIFLGIGIGITALLIVFNVLGIRKSVFYIIPGLVLWVCIFLSGIHATIAGVVLALTIPATKRIDLDDFFAIQEKSFDTLCEIQEDEDKASCYNRIITQISAIEKSCRNIQTPLQILEHQFIGIVAFFIVPLFAIANSGINFFALETNPFTERIFWGIFCGLVIGKPTGVFLFIFLLTRFKAFKLPSNIKWLHIMGIGFLMGIGFTMSNFIAGLAYSTDAAFLSSAKIAILVGSLISGVAGYVVFHFSIKKFKDKPNKTKSEEGDITSSV
ncbi:MAG: Na+/H+ antiporter NhaA [Candidatus Heimdallarchaeota archaeon]|nr:Na+/H+ antiporter NhaA [Candidatus Heimdallarchaeota archaeon]